MRQIDVTNYTVPLRNDRGTVRFKDAKCEECGLDLTEAEPTNPKIKSPTNGVAECPQCSKVNSAIIPVYLELPYYVKDSLIDLIMARDNQLSGKELLERDDIARKILCADGHVLLEEEEWSKLNTATTIVRGLSKPDVELIRRIVDAKKIEVEAKPKEKKK
ncbi:hypothetical protein ES703_26047 [subsurface metagenome]